MAAPEPGTGALVVHARHEDDREPAPGIVLIVARRGGDPRIEGRRERTDEAGTARWPSLPPGRLYVVTDSANSERVEITAGHTTEIDFELEAGLTVTGIVVDTEDIPVAGALVETTMMARADSYPEVVATSGPDGRFTARACPIYLMVGARAAGHTASPLRFLLGKQGNTADIKLVLGAGGGSVEGLVVDAEGQPVADAVVIIGEGQLSGIGGRDGFAGVLRGQAVTDELWLAPGDYEVSATAGALRGVASFTVGTIAGPPVQVAIR